MATLRHAHNKLVLRGKSQDRHGQTPEMMRIHVRPPEIADRQFSDNWVGDLIKGAHSGIAVGSPVEITSRLFMLIKLPGFNPSSRANALQAFSDKLLYLRMTMTQDRKMTMHMGLRKRTNIVQCTSTPGWLYFRVKSALHKKSIRIPMTSNKISKIYEMSRIYEIKS